MQEKQNDEAPVWAKELKVLIGNTQTLIKDFESDNKKILQESFGKEGQTLTEFKQSVETLMSGQTLFLNSIQVSAEKNFQQLSQQLELFRTLLARIDLTQSIIRRDTSDLELRFAELQKRMQTVESLCTQILEL